MITFLRTSSIFLIFSFSFTVLPMDPPVNPLRIQCVPWGDVKKKEKLLGGCFAALPKELFISFLVQSSPSAKNSLRKANKTFSSLLSWENIQPFMLCKELCASKQDIQSLIIPIIYQLKNGQANTVPTFKLKFLQDIGCKLTKDSEKTFSYAIPGSTHEYIGLSFCDNDASVELYGVNVGINYKAGASGVHPLIIACIARDPRTIAEYLQTMPGQRLNHEDFERALHILIQNNDAKSLALILDDKKNKSRYAQEITFPLASKLMQWTMFCASDKVIERIKHCYTMKNASTTMAANFQCPAEKDFIVEWLGLLNVEKGTNLHSIIELRHKKLTEKHSNNLEKYHTCLNILCNEHDLKKFNPPVVMPPVVIMDKKKHSKKSHKGRIPDCLIM